ncbi:hypothetical protein A7U60_g4772 [Sanghuangporus baumii]|uniref:Uncharacterized protein n=1 Tax=Sanghuangporus baumii TaxID=108892 RepID=A0A9Q5N8X7_SANBA|nr:hypothetical protein A7U60_g4772 [Sanghuangporus baumii]
MVHILDLPPELLIEIMKLATDNPVRDIEVLASWSRFETIYTYNRHEQSKLAIQTKYSLSLVCTVFRKLSLGLLYEDIWIRHGSDGLLETLERSRNGPDPGFGGYVKRVSLALACEEERLPKRDIYANVRRALMCCPNVRIIERHQEVTEEDQEQATVMTVSPIDDLEFRHLTRVDWHNTPLDSCLSSISSPRFIWNSDSLRVLIVGADNFPDQLEQTDPETVVCLPSVHTLGIRSFNTFGSERRRYQLFLPSLRRLVVGRPEAIYNFYSGCLAPLRSQISEIELEPEPRFLRHDFVTTLLAYCNNTTELCIPVGTTRPASRYDESPRTVLNFPIRRVCLHAGLPGSPGAYDQNDLLWWALLRGHFESLCAPESRFRDLESIVLCGSEWKETIEDARLLSFLCLAESRGVHIECEDEQLQRTISTRIRELSPNGAT